MKPFPKRLLFGALLAGLTGCLVDHTASIPVAKQVARSGPTVDTPLGKNVVQMPVPMPSRERQHKEPDPPMPDKDDYSIVYGLLEVQGDPAANFGSIYIPTTSLVNNSASTGCFRSANGWNRYFVMPGLFLGPNTPLLANPPCFTNSDNKASLKVDTCMLTNTYTGMNLETGIVIVQDDDPYTKQCRTNIGCNISPKLTVNTWAISPNTYYRATVYFKGSTLGTMTNVAVEWSYQ